MSLRNIFGILLIVFATGLAYWPALRGEFIMDDDDLLTNSNLIKSSDGLYRFWLTTEPLDYWPLTSTTFWLEWRLWGMNPIGYHATNVALHVVSAILIWAILQQLGIPGAFLAGLLFAVHPVNAESVAWIAQRKNTLAMAFFLLSILAYLKSAAAPEKIANALRTTRKKSSVRWIWYGLSLIAFALAMLSKGSVAILPLVLLLIAWWRQGRIKSSDLARSAPFFLVAIGLTAVNLWFQTHGSGQVIRDASFDQRLAGAGAVIWFYLSKALVPIRLIFVYPPWRIETADLLWWLPLVAALATTLMLWRQRNSASAPLSRALLFAWVFFCVALLPVLGFVDVGFMQFSLVADHYQHIALIAVAAIVAAGLTFWWKQTDKVPRLLAATTAALAVGGLGYLTWQQNQLYGQPVALYEATLVRNPQSWMAHNNLGLELAKDDRFDEAIQHYREALRLKPAYPEAENNWGAALIKSNRPTDALPHLEAALHMMPESPEAQNNLGNALKQSGQLPAAIEHYRQALRLNETFAAAHFNLGAALIESGQSAEAIEHFRQALRLKFDYPDVYNKLGAALSNTGQAQAAIEPLELALRLNPDFPEAQNNLGIALTKLDRLPEAIDQFERVLRDKPGYAEARLNFGVALAKAGKLPLAIQQFEEAARLKPDSIKAYSNLTKAYALMKRPQDAIAAAKKGAELARLQGQDSTAKEFESWLNLYRADQTNSKNASPPTQPPSPKP